MIGQTEEFSIETDNHGIESEASQFEKWLWQEFLWDQIEAEVFSTNSGVVEIVVKRGQIQEIAMKEL